MLLFSKAPAFSRWMNTLSLGTAIGIASNTWWFKFPSKSISFGRNSICWYQSAEDFRISINNFTYYILKYTWSLKWNKTVIWTIIYLWLDWCAFKCLGIIEYEHFQICSIPNKWLLTVEVKKFFGLIILSRTYLSKKTTIQKQKKIKAKTIHKCSSSHN